MVVPAGQSVTVSITFEINANAAGTSLSNHAEIAGDDIDDCDSTTDNDNGNDGTPNDNVIGTTCDDTDDEDDHDIEVIDIEPTIPRPEVRINKSVLSSGPYDIGEVVTYRIEVQNFGDEESTGVVVTDTFGAILVNPTVTSSSIGSTSVAGNTLIWTIGTLAPGQLHTLEMELTIGATAVAGQTAQNTAIVESDNEDPIPHDTQCINGDNPMTDLSLTTLTNNDDCETISVGDPVCGNNVIETGETCGEPGLAVCSDGYTCNNSCNCETSGG